MRRLFTLLISVMFVACGSDDDKVVEEQEPSDAPPKTWLADVQTPDNPVGKTMFYRAYYDDNVVVYYDLDTMDPDQEWVFKFVSDTWEHVKQIYQCTPEQKLYVLLIHNGGGGSPSYYYDSFYDHRNAFSCGPYANVITHEMFHIVESIAFGAHSYSAGFTLWGDSEIAQIFQYDVFKWYGWDTDAEEIKNWALDIHVNFPREGTYWSRDWFFPIYEQYGGTDVLVKFFKTLGEEYPANRILNMGEFVHFFSGAAGVNLKERAKDAFGWPYEYEAQFTKAREDFPQVVYPD